MTDTAQEFLLDPFTYQYWNPVFQRNWGIPWLYSGQYSTDVVAEKALGFLDDALKETKPFFLTIAPIGPHVEINVTLELLKLSYTISNGAPQPAVRHASLFQDVIVPRTENFNPDRVRRENQAYTALQS
jgi:hypothetical protein